MKKFLLSALAAAIGLASNFASAETVEVNMMTGSFNGTGNTLTATHNNVGVKLTSTKNDDKGNKFDGSTLLLLSSQNAPGVTITLESTSDDYKITGFSMDVKGDNGVPITLSSNNETITLGADAQKVEITGLDTYSFTLLTPHKNPIPAGEDDYVEWEKARITRFVVSLEGENPDPQPEPDPEIVLPEGAQVIVNQTNGSLSNFVYTSNATVHPGVKITQSSGECIGFKDGWWFMSPKNTTCVFTIESNDPAFYVKAFKFTGTTTEGGYNFTLTSPSHADITCTNGTDATVYELNIEEGASATFSIIGTLNESKKISLKDFVVVLAPIAQNPVISVEANAGGQAWIGEDREHHSFEFAKNVTSVTLHAEADTYYEFAGWLLGEEIVSTEADYTISTRPTEHMTHYVATFTYHGNCSVHLTQNSHRLMIAPGALGITPTNTADAKTKSYSIGMWFKCTNTSGSPLLMNFSTVGHNNYNGNWCVSYNTSTGKLTLNGHGSGDNGINNGTVTEDTYDGVIADEWNHLMVTVDQTTKTFKAYVNGQLAKTSVMPAGQDGIYLNVEDNTEKSNAHFMFGSNSFSGYIDEVQLFSTALTEDEVKLVYDDVWYTVSFPRNAKARYNAPAANGGAYNINSLAALYTYDTHTNGQFADQLNMVTTTSYLENITKTGTDSDVNVSSYRVTQTSPTIAETGREVKANGTETGISEVSADSNRSEAVYDLQGRRLAAPVKGINIINGKKVLVK